MASHQDKSRGIGFFERYHQETTWYGRVIIVEIYHLARISQYKNWTITRTAEDFGVSTSLISENLKLAEALHRIPELINAKSRLDALNQLNRRER